MSNVSVKGFQQTLTKANGDEVKMKKAFKGISAYLASSVSEKKLGQSLEDFLKQNPGTKKIHEWSDTVLVNNEYQLVNY